ncbi:MAG: hypothetical protein FD180_4389 [Planctomycetota bacterium]|nr:MAG: hypothetical protein FD180_4389 [Planctomycetota bacterium]
MISRLRAEDAYVFRHTLLRDAAYQLQLPGDRARLHGLAFAVMEALCGERAGARDCWLRGAERLRSIHAEDKLGRYKAEMREACARAGVPPFDGGGD